MLFRSVDVFSQKVLRIIGLEDNSKIREITGKMLRSDDYKIITGCGNLFVFKNIGPHGKEELLPLQEQFEYEEKTDFEIFRSLTIVDFDFPAETTIGETTKINLTFTKRESENLDGFIMFLSFVEKNTGETYQLANLPSFGIQEIRDWSKGRYYVESFDVVFPDFLLPSDYMVFVGINNRINTRSVYLGDIAIK